MYRSSTNIKQFKITQNKNIVYSIHIRYYIMQLHIHSPTQIYIFIYTNILYNDVGLQLHYNNKKINITGYVRSFFLTGRLLWCLLIISSILVLWSSIFNIEVLASSSWSATNWHLWILPCHEEIKSVTLWIVLEENKGSLYHYYK